MAKETKIKISEIDSNKRNRIFKKNVTVSFITKLISVLISYILVPLTMNYLNTEMYGVWITLLSMLSWFSFCDIGLGNGLRNKLTQCLSKNDIKSARKYVSTAYVSILVIAIAVMIPLCIIIPFVNWNTVFNINSIANSELVKLVLVVVVFFLINFFISIINQIYYAYQKSMLVGLIQLSQNILMTIGILLIRNLPAKSIVYLGLIYGISSLLVNMVFSILFFKNNNDVIPSVKEFSMEKVSDVLSLGLKFFVLQISSIIVFTTDNIMITQIVGPKYVTNYNVVQKILNILLTVHTILMTPLWSAYTEAYIKKDYKWIKNILKKLNLLMLPFITVTVAIYLSFGFIMKIWIRQSLDIPKSLIILVAIYTIIQIWNNIYAYFLNGVGILNISFYLSFTGAIINIPIAMYFGKFLGMGVNGIVLSNILTLLMSSLVQPFQAYCIINGKFKGSFLYK